MGTLFDISHFKWAESMQRRGTEEALEAKRQAEKYAHTSLNIPQKINTHGNLALSIALHTN